ncbi:unknown [Clostridium sp. CAG:609]|nr:unknown [Clostridium sp. CAG:609]
MSATSIRTKSNVKLYNYVKSKYTSQGSNGLYYHDSSLTNGAGDNSYRYAGASDAVNNYVCFGSTQSPCPADNLYRIIGVFGDRVKLIKSDYATSTLLGADGDYKQAYTATGNASSNYKGNNLANIAAYTWNYKNNTTINSGYGSNTWSTSLLNKTNLNTNFITNIGADWAAKIADTTWKVGGNTWANIGCICYISSNKKSYFSRLCKIIIHRNSRGKWYLLS